MLKRGKIVVVLLCACLCLFAVRLTAQTEQKVFHYPNGNVSSEGTLREGRPDGYWKTYFENGQLKSEGNRVDFMLDGQWIFYSEDGDTLMKMEYSKDLKHGLRITYKDDEILEEPFVKDVKSGTGRRLTKSGKVLQTTNYKDGFEDGFSPIYDTNGLVVTLLQYKRGYVTSQENINRLDGAGKKHGYWKTFYDDWSVHTITYYTHGLRNGWYKEYSENGNLLKITKYVNDVEQVVEAETMPIEMRYEYYANGKIKREASFRNGKPEGAWRDFDEKGNVTKTLVYSNGKVVGQGILGSDGKRVGEWKEYYADSTLKSKGIYEDGLKSGKWQYYYPDGGIEQVGFYRNGKEEGRWTWYHPNKQIMREEGYLGGLLEGSYKEYDMAGKEIVTGNYKFGMRTGKWIENIGDRVNEGEYRNDKKEGLWVSKFSNGKTASKGNYVAGSPNGEHVLYYDNGNVREIQTYTNGLKNGVWKKFFESGELFMQITYQNGAETKYDDSQLDKDEIVTEERVVE